MAGIFISYRREDSAGWTGRLAERLKQKFGSESIFMDIDTIQPGTDFTEAVRSAVVACDVLLAMIGPEWSVAKSAEGQTRLEDPNDWIRMEITTALSRNIPVIPVLVGGASLPKMSTLPEDLRKLFHYQSHELTDKRWEYDATQLIQVLEKVVHGMKPKRYISGTLLTRPSRWAALGVLGLLLVGSIQFFKGLENSQRSKSEISPTGGVTRPPEPKVLNVADSIKETSKAPASSEKVETENTSENEHSTASQRELEMHIAATNAPIEKAKSETRSTSTSSGAINLLSPENGGHIVVADKERWVSTIDGNEKDWDYVGRWAVYGFKNDGPATFDTFKVLILETTGLNVKEFELLAGNDSPTGKFQSIGKYETQNVRFFKNPWQEFKFPSVKARYLKVQIISSHGDRDGALTSVVEFQLLGGLVK